MKLNSTILSTSYFPPIKYFKSINTFEFIYIEQHEYHKRHSIRNRTLIIGPNNSLLLTVPIVKKKYSKTAIRDIKISDQNWKKRHINTIKSSYGSSPFFIYYFQEISKIINKNHTFLIDLNYEILFYLLTELSVKKDINKTKSYIKKYPTNFLDQRDKIKINMNFEKYTQVFNKNFIPNLSIIDLMFNLGPNAKEYICTR